MLIGSMTRGVIFDVDGTLVLSNAAHAAAWSRAFAECGFFDVPPALVGPLIGMGGRDLVKRVKPDAAERIVADVTKRHERIFRADYLPRLRPAPGARDLVLELADRDLALIVATSAKEAELKALLKVARVDDLLTNAVTADEVERAKPASDLVSAALARLDLDASAALMIGDTVYDIEAAHRAGVRVIAVRCGGSPERVLSEAGAVFDDPEAIVKSIRQTGSMPIEYEESRRSAR